MKTKLVSLIILFAFVSYVYPQGMTEKGSRSIFGNFTVSHMSVDESDASSTQIIVAPGYSYFISDNFEFGGALRFSYTEYSDMVFDVKYTTTSKSLGLGPFANYYFGKSSTKPFLGASLTYATPLESDSYSVFSVGLNAGFLIPVNQKIAITPFIEYDINMYSKDYMNNTRLFTVGAQFKMFW
jgi:hypothetical protein